MTKRVSHDEKRTVIAIGPFPPFVGGAAKNTALICDAVELRGCRVVRIVTNGSRERQAHLRNLSGHIVKIRGFFLNIHRIYQSWRAFPKSRVYLVPDGGSGVILSAIYVFVALMLFSEIVVHHRSFGYILRPSFFMRIIVRSSQSRITHIFLDESMVDQFQGLYGGRYPYFIVGNAATCDVTAAEPLKEMSGPISIGFLSNLVEDKGFDIVASAFPELLNHFKDGVEFLIAGRPVGTINEQRLEALMISLGAKLRYYGEVSGAAKTEFFNNCWIFVFPTRFDQEASPNVLYEAMAAGAAIISTRWVGIPSLLDGAVAKLISTEPDNAAELVAAVAGLIEGDELVDVRQRQVEVFRAKKLVADAQYLKLLEKLSSCA